MRVEDLMVLATEAATGKRIYGYVCACDKCRAYSPSEEYDRSRPTGLLTHPNSEYGNVRVYTDDLEIYRGG